MESVNVIDDCRFALQTPASSYVFALDPAGLLRHLHWGRPIRDLRQFDVRPLEEVSTNDPVANVTPEEYPVHGGFRYSEICLRVVLPDGSRELRMRVTGHRVADDVLIVQLFDGLAGVALDVCYRVISDLDVIERWAVLRNEGSHPVTVKNFASGQLHIPATDLWFTNVQGHWNAEQQQFRQRVSYGKIVVDSRRGTSTHHHNPYLILDRDAGEHYGDVWFAALSYGGNFKGVVEQTQYGGTLAQLGLNDYDFAIVLEPGDEEMTPIMVIGYSSTGFADMSHRLHAYGRRLMRNPAPRPVLYNSWEAAAFNVSCDQQIALAHRAAAIGVELFVMDDGWFSERHSISDGLGDWYANPQKFPAGVQPLVDEVHRLGMKFGIWFEPEAVSPRTRLIAEHPDWIYSVPGRPSEMSREQYLLDISRPDVAEHVFSSVHNFVTAHDVDYVKWDVNRPIAQAGTDRSVWKRHFDALYDIVDRLHVAHPRLLIEACASGGGRIDFGTLRHFDDFWTSDNTDAFDRLEIQRSYSFVYPLKAMRAWVTDVPNFMSQRFIPLRFRFHSAMMGSLGIGLDLGAADEAELAQCAEHIKHYKRIRDVIQEGLFTRLEVHSSNDYRGFQYTLGDRTALLVFLPQTKIGFHGETPKLRLHGLQPDAVYAVTGDHVDPPGRYHGDFLMNLGLTVRMTGDYASTILEVVRI